jgi:polyhydroxyalkanoate synthesis regulator phasin
MTDKLAEIFRKMTLFGIGTIALSQEKIEEFTEEMVKKGEINREEGKKFVLDFLSEKDRQRKEVTEKISEKVKEAMQCSGVAMKKDVDDLSERTGKLEEFIENLRKL